MLLWKTRPLLTIINKTLLDLPTPSNISYIWNFGRLLGLCLLTQILSGLLLAIHFTRDATTAFKSVSHITRNINRGWILRFTHANSASIFFFLIYIHIGRGLYYSSFFKISTWFTGILILFTLIATAFLGYVLPWGQMSFWGATVITNLLSAVPYIGPTLTHWVWGGFSVDRATLTRFFTIHFIAPLGAILLVRAHIIFLHDTGSNNPLGTPLNTDKLPFHPYFTWKDTYSALILILLIGIMTLLRPYYFSDPDNFTPANPLITPPHIQPEWYFLFAYAILRSIPNKLGGVIALLLSILALLLPPLIIKNNFRAIYFYPLNKIIFWILINTFILLTYLGRCPIEEPYRASAKVG